LSFIVEEIRTTYSHCQSENGEGNIFHVSLRCNLPMVARARKSRVDLDVALFRTIKNRSLWRARITADTG
jgi:hypothetical protein